MTAPARRDADQISELGGFPGCSLTPTGLVFDGDLPDFDQWRHIGFVLGRVRNATQWAIGDWLLAGETLFGELAAQAVEETGLKKDTLLQFVRVARNVQASRRRPTISWSHHQAAAALDPAEQDRLLSIAEDKRLSLEEFRGLLREAPARRLAVENRPPAAEIVELVWSIGQTLLRAARDEGDGTAVVPAAVLVRLANALGVDWPEEPS